MSSSSSKKNVGRSKSKKAVVKKEVESSSDEEEQEKKKEPIPTAWELQQTKKRIGTIVLELRILLQEEDETSEEEVEDEGGELDTDGNPIMIFRKKQKPAPVIYQSSNSGRQPIPDQSGNVDGFGYSQIIRKEIVVPKDYTALQQGFASAFPKIDTFLTIERYGNGEAITTKNCKFTKDEIIVFREYIPEWRVEKAKKKLVGGNGSGMTVKSMKSADKKAGTIEKRGSVVNVKGADGKSEGKVGRMAGGGAGLGARWEEDEYNVILEKFELKSWQM